MSPDNLGQCTKRERSGCRGNGRLRWLTPDVSTGILRCRRRLNVLTAEAEGRIHRNVQRRPEVRPIVYIWRRQRPVTDRDGWRVSFESPILAASEFRSMVGAVGANAPAINVGSAHRHPTADGAGVAPCECQYAREFHRTV